MAATATVMRDGAWREVAQREVVPDDLIRLSAGDLVPADAVLLEAKDLHVQQAALTGESLPEKKQADASAAATGQPDAPNMVFLGTSVVSGTALAGGSVSGAAFFADAADADSAEQFPLRSLADHHPDRQCGR